GNALAPRVLERRLRRVTRKILALPDVDAGRFPGRELLRRADEKQPAAAADVEHLLVAAPVDLRKQLLTPAQFPETAAPPHPERPGQQSDRHEQNPDRSETDPIDSPGPDAGLHQEEDGQRRTTGDHQIPDDIRSVDAVISRR